MHSTDASRYRERLYHHGYGYPLWPKESNAALSESQKAVEIKIGDIGILTADGGFDYLGNVHLPVQQVDNKSPDTQSLAPITSGVTPPEERKIGNFFLENTVISSSNVEARGLEPEGEVQASDVSGGGGFGIEFSTDGNAGAILVLPQGASRADACDLSLYRNHAAQNAEAWYQDLGSRVQSGSLYLVTGVDECSSWGIASFANPSPTFLVSGAASSGVSVGDGIAYRTGAVKQCVFARGFVIAFRGTSETVSKGPAAILADELLTMNNTASFAVVHDNDWIVPTKRGNLAQGPEGVLKDIEHVAKSLTTVVVGNGICTLPGTAPDLMLWHGVEVPVPLKAPDAVRLVQNHVSPNIKYSAALTVPGTAEPIEVRSDVQPRLFALVIGIDKYEDGKICDLHGAVADANAVVKFLTTKVGVSASRIRNLRDHDATRANIIAAITSLKSNESIERDDPILIYYAGHGAEAGPSQAWDTVAPAPIGWEAGGPDAHIQLLVPHDFAMANSTLLSKQGILDLELARFLSELAQAKGNNITVIFDCCHSGHATRDPFKLDIRVRGIELPAEYKIHSGLLRDELQHQRADMSSTRALASAKINAVTASLESHVLLAACAQSEYAGEVAARGRFTSALLDLLRDVDPRTVTYVDIIKQLQDLPNQHPQCVGNNRTRILFNGKSSTRISVLHPVTIRSSGRIVLGAGQAHGIAAGAKFNIFATRNIDCPPTCSLAVSTTHMFSAFLVPTGLPRTVPQPGWAVQTTIDVIKVALADVPGRPPIRFVDFDPDGSHQLVVRIESGLVVFVVADQISSAAGLTRLPTKLSLNDIDGIHAVIESASHFFYHLRRSNPDAPLAGKVIVEAFELEEDELNPHTGVPQMTAYGSNLVNDVNATVQVKPSYEQYYGFKLTNKSDDELFVNAFTFDMSDFGIVSIYQCNDAKAMAEPSILPKGSLTLGYGSGGTIACRFTLPEGADVDVAYLKIFITTIPLDLSDVPRKSPFDPFRKMETRSVARKAPVWDSLLVAIIQKNV